VIAATVVTAHAVTIAPVAMTVRAATTADRATTKTERDTDQKAAPGAASAFHATDPRVHSSVHTGESAGPW
jgi:hypothetical protein